MSGRRSTGLKRRKHDLYETPAWVVTDCLLPFFPVRDLNVLEPACGNGKMLRALEMGGALEVTGVDIVKRRTALFVMSRGDFRKLIITTGHFDAIVTNPPYGEGGALAVEFIEKALAWLREFEASGLANDRETFVALLLPVDFDLAVGRIHLFERCPEYHGCIRLRRRIAWFKPKRKAGQKKANGPSQNHAWFIWKSGPRPDEFPVTMYAPSTGALL